MVFREYLSTYEVLQTYSYNMFICYYNNWHYTIQYITIIY